MSIVVSDGIARVAGTIADGICTISISIAAISSISTVWIIWVIRIIRISPIRIVRIIRVVRIAKAEVHAAVAPAETNSEAEARSIPGIIIRIITCAPVRLTVPGIREVVYLRSVAVIVVFLSVIFFCFVNFEISISVGLKTSAVLILRRIFVVVRCRRVIAVIVCRSRR
jgi:hypothetical protein